MSFVLPGDTATSAIAAALTATSRDDERVAHMLYLVDWKCAIEHRRRATGIVWTIHERSYPDVGPVADHVSAVRRAMRMVYQIRSMGQAMGTVSIDGVDEDVADCIRHVVRETATMDRVAFIRLVMSTHPCLRGRPEGGFVDMPALAEEYAKLNADARA